MIETGLYQHFKGGYYYVLGEAIHTETREKLVIYRSQESAELQARPYDMFIEKVQPGIKRFTKI